MALPDLARWRRLEALVEAALEQPEDSRLAWLAAQPEDESLRRDALRLLRASSDAPDWLQPPAQTRVGQKLGAWRVVRELGRGGMGVVYLGEREDGQFRQRAAIKLLSAALASEGRRARFLAERQLLAELEHPGIARLIEGGATEDGLPWFALEYVDGVGLTEFCAREALTVDARLRLLLQVCDVVRFAHSRLVVHRDLKPGNILVTADGQVKLLDFGIAKLLDAARADATHELRPLTPAYAAPEQQRGGSVTVATDVWALGVLLYELLTGRRPFEAPEGDAAALIDAVLHRDPPPPSAVVGDAALARQLRGDLDTIVLRALAKEPERRYASVESLADDLQRHLAVRPIRARPDRLGYRLGKYVRRHRWGVAGAALAVSLLVGAGIGLVWQAERARAEANRAELVKEFMVDLFALGDPDRAQGREVTARELLAEGARRVETTFAGEPRLLAEFRRLIGTLYLRVGDTAVAIETLGQAVADSVQAFGDGSREALLARLDLAEARLAAGDAALAESELAALMPQAQRAGAALHARALALTGDALRAQSRYADAESSLRQALDIDRGRGAEGEAIARDLYYLGGLALGRGEYGAAKAHLEEALSIFNSDFGESSTNVALVLRDLGSTSAGLGDHAGAERLLRRSLAIYERLLGDRHPSVAHTAALLAAVLRDSGRSAEAEPLLRRALEIDRARFGPRHERTLSDRHQLALTLIELGQLDAAAEQFAEASRAAARGDAPHGLRGALELGRGALALARQDHREADTAYRTAAEEFELDADGAGGMALALRGLGYSALLQARNDEAVVALRRALAAAAALPPNDPNRILILANLSQAEAIAGDGAAALQHADAAELAADRLPRAHRLRGLALLARARAELASGQPQAAAATLRHFDAAKAPPYAPYTAAEAALLRHAVARAEASPEACALRPDAVEPGWPVWLQAEARAADAACAEG